MCWWVMAILSWSKLDRKTWGFGSLHSRMPWRWFEVSFVEFDWISVLKVELLQHKAHILRLMDTQDQPYFPVLLDSGSNWGRLLNLRLISLTFDHILSTWNSINASGFLSYWLAIEYLWCLLGTVVPSTVRSIQQKAVKKCKVKINPV